MDLGNLTAESTVVNVDLGANNDCLAELLVCTSYTGVVTLNLSINGDDKFLALGQCNILILSERTSLDLWTFRIQHHCALLVLPLLQRFFEVLHGFEVSLHADN